MPWLQLTFHVPPDQAQQLSDLLSELGAVAVTMQDGADQPLYEPPPGATPLWNHTCVTGLFAADRKGEQLRAELAEHLAPEPLPRWHEAVIEDQDWERAWMDDFRPMRYGRRLWIVPSWHEPPEPDAINILLDPGLAFGSGTHATTRLCLEWLDSVALTDRQVIDYGCGSGILAIAAAKLGAKEVVAIDNDPQALQATSDNGERNGIAEKIAVFLPGAAPPLHADILVANILAGPLITLAPTFASLLKEGALIALSGILPEQADEVLTAYRDGFDMQPAVELDGWIRLEGKRK
jgi:ribosomal protein L11 methyltransferase